jgi:hypothetical protein
MSQAVEHLLCKCEVLSLNSSSTKNIWWAFYLMEEISRQLCIRAAAWLVLSSFSHIYSENQERKWKQKDLKNLEFGQKRRMHKVGA